MANAPKSLQIAALTQFDYTQTVGENIATSFQDLIDERFESSTSLTTIQEQETNGGTTYKNLRARVCHTINTNTGENFGDQWRKIIFKTPTYPKDLGYMYKFGGHTWLATNTDTRTNLSGHAIVRMCNNTIKWVSKVDNTTLLTWDCVFTNQITNTSFDYGAKDVVQVSADILVLVQRNPETNQITYNDRFIFDGQAFQVNQVNNHISETYLILKMIETQVLPNDDLENNIAGAQNLPPVTDDIKILPNVLNIIVGDTQVYTVYNYNDSLPLAHTFTITASGLGATYYTLTAPVGNSFSVTALKASNTPLAVKCVDNTTAGIIYIYIMFTEGW
jgi:hypothetical protein